MANFKSFLIYSAEGYPKGLKGDEIVFGSRVIVIVDAYDAMTSVRSYRSSLLD